MTLPILVTGAPGNVGTPLVHELLATSASVRVAAWDVEAARAAFGDRVEIVRFDMTDPATFGAFEGAERMFLLRPPAIADVKGVVVRPSMPPGPGGFARLLPVHPGRRANRVVPHRKIEDALRRSDLTWTFVRAAYFMQNLSTTHAREIRELDESGPGRSPIPDRARGRSRCCVGHRPHPARVRPPGAPTSRPVPRPSPTTSAPA